VSGGARAGVGTGDLPAGEVHLMDEVAPLNGDPGARARGIHGHAARESAAPEGDRLRHRSRPDALLRDVGDLHQRAHPE